ncbi:hypothetical protein VTK56DRAFT_6736 [Thermocarpiscus australiensis]
MIWKIAALDAATTPSVRFVTMRKGDADLEYERQLVDRAARTAANDPALLQLTDDERSLTTNRRIKEAVRDYRGSLVSLAHDTDMGGSARYSAAVEVRELAMSCPEAERRVAKHMASLLARRKEERGPMKQASGKDCDFLLKFDLERDIVCLRGPERDPTVARHADLAYFCVDIVLGRQVVAVSSPSDRQLRGPEALVNAAFNVLPKCRRLVRICPGLARLRGVAFLYDESDGDSTWPYDERLGLRGLRPGNLRALEEICLLDRSITLKAGVQEPPASVPQLAGYRATFYEVGTGHADVLDIATPEGSQIPVFRCAAAVQAACDGYAQGLLGSRCSPVSRIRLRDGSSEQRFFFPRRTDKEPLAP